MPRPTKLTARTRNALLRAIRGGASYAVAARAAGIAERTFHNWRARGEAAAKLVAESGEALPADDPEHEFLQFVQLLTHAEAEGHAARIARLEAAGKGGAKVEETVEMLEMEAARGPDGRIRLDESGNPVMVVAKQRTTKTIRRALPDWRADAWVQERRGGDEWIRKEKREHSGEIATKAYVGISPDDWDEDEADDAA